VSAGEGMTFCCGGCHEAWCAGTSGGVCGSRDMGAVLVVAVIGDGLAARRTGVDVL
jgi:hypothetical protein